MLKQYREIEYTDDGCARFECLACKSQWEVRYTPTVYCGNCGIKFDGELIWDEKKCGHARKWNVPSESRGRWDAERMLIHSDGTKSHAGWGYIGGSVNYQDIAPQYTGVAKELYYCLEEIRTDIKEEMEEKWDMGMYYEYRIVYKQNNAIVKEFPVKLTSKRNVSVAQMDRATAF